MIHPLDIILAILVAFLAREWFILRWPGDATEGVADESENDLGRMPAQVGTPSAASPVRQAGDNAELRRLRR